MADEGDKPTLNRRDFLAGLAGGIIGLYAVEKLEPQLQVTKFLNAVQGKSIEHTQKPISGNTPTSEPPTTTVETITSIPKKEIVSGVELYGTKEEFDTEAKVNSLNNYFNSVFEQRLKNQAQKDGVPIPQNQFEQRQYLLNRDQRYLQVYIKKSLYEKFQEESTQGGLNAIDWFKNHIDIMNNQIKENMGPKDLDVVLQRMIVVSDDFDDRLDKHLNLPNYPLDIDGQWNFWHDYRGDINPHTHQFAKSGYLSREVINGKNVIVDYGLSHELFHQVLSWPDEYIQNVEKDTGIIPFKITGGEGLKVRTPWFGYNMQRAKRLDIRGMSQDPRNLGVNGAWNERPEKNVFHLVDKAGQPLNGEVEILKVSFQKDQGFSYYNQKSFSHLATVPLQNGKLETTTQWFSSQVETNHLPVYPTNWLIKIKTQNNQDYLLHFPVAAFNMTKIAGKDDATYSIQFTEPEDPKKVDQQNLTMGFENTKITTPQGFIPYALMRVDGTPVNFMWSIGMK